MVNTLASLGSAGIFYPLFGLIVAGWLLVRFLLRRRVGPVLWGARVRLLEQAVVAILLLGMLGLAVLQIFLRNFFQTGLVWIDPLTRHLVLWIGFVGATVASGQLRHIHMDVLARLLPVGPRLWVLRLTTLLAAFVCALLARAAWLYLVDEAAFGSRGFLRIPTWMLTSILFVGFAVIAARFASRALESDAVLQQLERRAHGADEEGADSRPPDREGETQLAERV